ncbi:hypothetical protein GDO78_015859 [Eleutherodactylus coqui]|uniref:Uncharacterized protein n=1 Tax=Eleutherodactylus coqui TaxID=57060 RepID=A0A8J6EQD7_ELECQ|nr:hypothetical protein GDO78_015859 [Eleutherodactylus coqui]
MVITDAAIPKRGIGLAGNTVSLKGQRRHHLRSPSPDRKNTERFKACPLPHSSDKGRNQIYNTYMFAKKSMRECLGAVMEISRKLDYR